MLTTDKLKKFSRDIQIDAIGWFRGEQFKDYLDIIVNLKDIYNFKYKPYEDFLKAGSIDKRFKSVIVIIKDYYYEPTSSLKGLKLSNYSRFCWPTINPGAEEIIHFLSANGYLAELINVPDKAAACKAGLGFIGKNSLFYAFNLGSFVGIRVIGTNLELDEYVSSEEQVKNSKCTNCNKCIKSCPTGAINKEGYRINPLKCISFINRHIDELKNCFRKTKQK